MPTPDFAKLIKDDGLLIEESPFFPNAGLSFWQSNLVDEKGRSMGAGFGKNRLYSRKVAIAEFLERRSFREISASTDKVRDAWGLNLIPTACGFAAGFEEKNTVVRSLSEAAERWVMSKWIDDQCQIDEIPLSSVINDLDEVSKFILSNFQKVRLFEKSVRLFVGHLPIEISVAQTFGFLDGGVYPGSSAQAAIGPIWQHAFLESFRHLLYVRNNPVKIEHFLDEKIRFFSKNSAIALSQIDCRKFNPWPEPKIIFQKVEFNSQYDFYLARTILGGWNSWHLGPMSRFLY